MESQSEHCTATKALLLAVLLFAGGSAWAASAVGTVTRLSGPLLAKKADGTVKILSLKSEVAQGDTLMSEKNTYAQIRFTDNSEMTVRPGTSFTIENFAFDPAKPDGDSAIFSLLKGSLRSTTGLLGKRNKEKFSLRTPTGIIGIHGTTFIASYVPSPLPNGSGTQLPAQPTLSPGLHLQVTDGAIVVANNGGSLGFQAGQFGYVPAINQPPVLVPSNPSLQFVPPPSFYTSPSPIPSGAINGSPGNATDCIVR